jgi:hypothetical protein
MATLTKIAGVGRKRGPMTRLPDTLQHSRSISGRVLVAALCVVVLSAFFAVAVSAQQNPQPQSEAPPAAAAPVSSAAASSRQSLVARLARFQRYPSRARGGEGVVNLAFSIDRHGNVASTQVVKTSGSALLDAEAFNLIFPLSTTGGGILLAHGRAHARVYVDPMDGGGCGRPCRLADRPEPFLSHAERKCWWWGSTRPLCGTE